MKKPIYKRKWFIAVIVILILAVIGSFLPDDSTTDEDQISETQTVEEVTEEAIEETESPPEDDATMGEKNALASAENYLFTMPFSYTGLIDQLEYEGYTTEEATYAADNCGADWNEQAAKAAQNYIDTMAFSRDGLIEQLEYEGYTHEQAVYGVTSVGY